MTRKLCRAFFEVSKVVDPSEVVVREVTSSKAFPRAELVVQCLKSSLFKIA